MGFGLAAPMAAHLVDHWAAEKELVKAATSESMAASSAGTMASPLDAKLAEMLGSLDCYLVALSDKLGWCWADSMASRTAKHLVAKKAGETAAAKVVRRVDAKV